MILALTNLPMSNEKNMAYINMNKITIEFIIPIKCRIKHF